MSHRPYFSLAKSAVSPPEELAYPRLAGFDVQKHLATVTEAARQRSCLLCGGRHEPRIQDLDYRSTRGATDSMSSSISRSTTWKSD